MTTRVYALVSDQEAKYIADTGIHLAITVQLQYIIWKIFGNVKMYIIHDKDNKQSSYRCRRKQILSKYGNMSLLWSQIAKYCFIRTEATDVDKPQIVTNRASHSLVVGNIIGHLLRLPHNNGSGGGWVYETILYLSSKKKDIILHRSHTQEHRI